MIVPWRVAVVAHLQALPVVLPAATGTALARWRRPCWEATVVRLLLTRPCHPPSMTGTETGTGTGIGTVARCPLSAEMTATGTGTVTTEQTVARTSLDWWKVRC